MLGATVRGKYRLDRLLGVGGMASVFAATHRNSKAFAVKMLHPELSSRADVRGRFLREGYLANKVGHEGAVAVLDDDVTEDGGAFLVMELLDGESLDAIWERAGRKVPVPFVLAIAEQLLDVLVAAHAAGIVHRDIKPANVFVTRSGQLKVLDFGVARLKNDTTGLVSTTRTGSAMGTPAFMAPEQALGKASQVDETSDVWAVGATMFTLLSGAIVHEADTVQELLVFAATRHARPLASAFPEAPPELARVVDRALAMDKAERWATAASLQDALRQPPLTQLLVQAPRDTLVPWLKARGPSPCPSEDTLAELLEGCLSPAARLAVDAHLDGCGTCRDLMRALTKESASIDHAMASALGRPSIAPTDVGVASTVDAGPDAARGRAPPRYGRAAWAGTALVVAAGATVVLAVGTRAPSSGRAVSSGSMVAVPAKELRAARLEPPASRASGERVTGLAPPPPAPEASVGAVVRPPLSMPTRVQPPVPVSSPRGAATTSASAPLPAPAPWDHL